MLKILVSNDDGIEAEGIRKLVKTLARRAKVYVCAPASQRSAMSQAMTIRAPIYVQEASCPGASAAITTSGTPVDCVKYGLEWLKEQDIRPDYVIAGINMGANVGIDINYSGTVGAAIEGALNGYRAIALSVASHTATHFEYICSMIPEILKMRKELPVGMVLNVNVPDTPAWEVKGVRYVDGRVRGFCDEFTEVPAEELADAGEQEGEPYRYTGTPYDYSRDGEEHDLAALSQGYATITPISLNRIDYALLAQLRGMASQRPLCLFLDVQEGRLEAMRRSRRFQRNLRHFAESVARLELPALVTEQYSHENGAVSAMLRSALGKHEKLEKVSFDASATKELRKLLRKSGNPPVVLCGLEAHVSVLQTALGLREQGYAVTVLRDCCASRRQEDLEAAMALLLARGCTVTTGEAFLYRLLGAQTHYDYRAIAAIYDSAE